MHIAEEVASLGLVALIFLSLPATFQDRGFLRIDVLHQLLGGKTRIVLAIVFHVAALAVTSVYLYYLTLLALDSFQRGTRSDMALGTPNYLPQIFMVTGMLMLVAVIVRNFFRIVRKLFGGSTDD